MESQDPPSPALLFSEEEMALERVGSPAFTGASTGERLYRDRPELYRIVVQLLGQGNGIREIMRITGLHNKTITAVREREGTSIDTLKKVHASGHSMVVELGIELAEEAFTQGTIHGVPVKLKLGDIAMATKLHFDMKQILSGGVTARVERVEQSQVAAGLERMLDDLPVIDAELVEDVSGINLVAGNTDAIAALSGPDHDALIQQIAEETDVMVSEFVCQIDQAEINVQTPTTDEQSVVSDAVDSVEEPIASDPASVPVKKPIRKPKVSKAKVTPPAATKAPAAKSKAPRSTEGGRGSRSKPKAKNRD